MLDTIEMDLMQAQIAQLATELTDILNRISKLEEA